MTAFADYAGKQVIVTGFGSGIGKATARLLARLGARVIGMDRNPAALDGVSFVPIDLGDPRSIDGAMDAIDGPVDALFNCAGLAPTQPPLDVLRVNFLGTRELTDRVVGRMARGGAIVSTSSNSGLGWAKRLPELLQLLDERSFEDGLRWIEPRVATIGNPYAYGKEALVVWTMQQSAILIARGVRINCTSPGAVQTPMLEEIEARVPAAAIDAVAKPIGRRSTADEQAWPLVMINSDAASYINGANVPVDGGFAAAAALAG
jgi:NAD(P)-dependent dehydrogenase (short-subunit alcohol dehydrogenase family)